MVRGTIAGVRDLWARRSLVSYLIRSDLQTSLFRKSIGFLTWIVQPLSLVLIYWFLLSIIFRSSQTNVVPFLLAALIPWRWISGTLRQAPEVITSAESLIQRVRFPNAVLVLSLVGRETVFFLFAVLLTIGASWAYGKPPTQALLCLPIVVLVTGLFCFGLALLFAALGVFFRDLPALLDLLLPFWFYCSPGIYSADLVPESIRPYFLLNPVAILFEAYRSVLVDGKTPDPIYLGSLAGASVLLCLMALAIFGRCERKFVKYL